MLYFQLTWKRKSETREKREGPPASCVFEKKIIVSGGVQNLDFGEENHQILNTVEAYDPIDNTWTEFPKMNYSRCSHMSVVINNKLFVIAGGTDINEVYESTSKKFTALKPSLGLYNIGKNYPFAVFKISHKLFVYFSCSSNVFCFDTTKGQWYKNPSKLAEHLTLFSAFQVPRL